jgi:hypothetical protein
MRHAIDLAGITVVIALAMLLGASGFALGITTSDAAPTCTTQTGDFIFADIDGKGQP